MSELILLTAVFAVGCVVGKVTSHRPGDSGRLRRLEKKMNLILSQLGVQEIPSLSSAVQELARDPRNKIAAIKLHREQTGCGLAEAKMDVEDFMATLDQVRRS